MSIRNLTAPSLAAPSLAAPSLAARSLAALSLALVLALAACADDDDSDAEPPGEATPTEEPDEAPDHLAAVGTDTWTTLESAPEELTEVDAVAFDGEIWTVGGLAADAGVVTTVLVYDPGADEWREGPAIPEPVHHAALVATDDALVMIGGYRTLGFDPVDRVAVLDPARGEWVDGPNLPAPRGAGAAAWDGTRVVFGGGVGPDGLAGDVWALNWDADTLDDGDVDEIDWAPVGELGTPRDHLDATSDGDGTVWFLAGREESLTANLATVDLLAGDEIREIGALPTPRGGVAAFYAEAHGACLAGGEEPEGTFAEVECIDAEGNVTTLPDLAHARHGLGADVVDGIAFVVLGGPEPALAVSATVEALRVSD